MVTVNQTAAGEPWAHLQMCGLACFAPLISLMYPECTFPRVCLAM